jgi:hypothetical protein
MATHASDPVTVTVTLIPVAAVASDPWYLFSGSPPVPDTTPPVVSGYSPTVGTPIAATTPLVFDVTEETSIRRILVTVEIPAGRGHEVAHDGDAFTATYASGSTRAPISGGYRYTLLRRGGWSAAPTIHVFAFDSAGNEAI